MVNRGYSSVTAMHDAALRFRQQEEVLQKNCIILYLGDHDPSGIDMVRDIRDRLFTFCCDIEVERIALSKDQILEYRPPPNPAKIDDPRANNYIKKYGNISWELDALKPEILSDLVESNILKYLDSDEFQKVVGQENQDKVKLKGRLEII